MSGGSAAKRGAAASEPPAAEPPFDAGAGEPGLESDNGRSFSIKQGDTFVVADAWGDILGGADGLFHDDTRILSRLRLLIGGERPSRLSADLSRDGSLFTLHATNHRLPPVGGAETPRGVIHIERRRCLGPGRLHEQIRLTNHGLDTVMVPVSLTFAADFGDIFEVRGARRPRRGEIASPRLTGRGVTIVYRGLDGVERCSAISMSPPPGRLTAEQADFLFAIERGHGVELYLEAGAQPDQAPDKARFEAAAGLARRRGRALARQGAIVEAADGALDAWLRQSRADVATLTTRLATGSYPYAGVPWFSTAFGRDGIVTAWQMLWLDSSLARGVLAFLAENQATARSTFADSAPGKVLHEVRRGEMAALGEVPFGAYYGGVDTTPLFVALAGAYLARTDDTAFVGRLWPALLRACAWMEADGDANGDGLIDYQRGAAGGLTNQGWKDSVDSVFHDDGRLPPGPIALVEVQGYAFAAYRAMAAIAARLALGAPGDWLAKAEGMRARVERRFWNDARDYYGLAIDGEGALCRPLSSNPGHLLFVGLPSGERAGKVVHRLMSAKFDSGWGLRTIASDARRYNPMSYHNGSVWPHDTAIAAAGMARYGERDGPAKLFADLFGVAKAFQMRMPELLCGFAREAEAPPIAYPSACMPQAWAAGSAFMLLQACLGLSIDAARREVRIARPTLPEGLDQLSIRGLAIGEASLDLMFRRIDGRMAALPSPAAGGAVSVIIEG